MKKKLSTWSFCRCFSGFMGFHNHAAFGAKEGTKLSWTQHFFPKLFFPLPVPLTQPCSCVLLTHVPSGSVMHQPPTWNMLMHTTLLFTQSGR